MTIKREAAYHEAAHAVLAHNSKYHAVVGEINLLKYGGGEVYLSLSKAKCAAEGKPQDPSAQFDKDVAQDFAVVLCGGLMAEQIASERDSTLIPNPKCADPDHWLVEQQLRYAGLSKKYDKFQAKARCLLEQNWETVERLADYLLQHQSANPEQIFTIIEINN